MSIHQQRLDNFCDRCPARASVEVFLGSSADKGKEPDLRFCQHHYDEASVKLLTLGATIVNENEPAKV